MCLAKDRDVDMVLLSGDLFHDNKPSRKAMYQVMKTLRQNCYGEKPCEIEVLSDTSLEFQSAGGHVNYEDPDINVAIPVFSIHGNHDDPSGVGTGVFFHMWAVLQPNRMFPLRMVGRCLLDPVSPVRNPPFC